MGMRKKGGVTPGALFACLFLLLVLLLQPVNSISANAEESTLKNPVHHHTGKGDYSDYTEWSYVYFGAYPQEEITDADLIAKIDEALTAQSMEKGDVWVDGNKYRKTDINDCNSDSYFGEETYRYFKWRRIKWRVVQITDDKALLISDCGLFAETYNETSKYVTWETCTLRSYLNGYSAETNLNGIDYTNNNFRDSAFNKLEQSAILDTELDNSVGYYSGVSGGNDTVDKIFLLTLQDLTNPEYGFCSDYECASVSRQMDGTAYTNAMGGLIRDDKHTNGHECVWWWSRTRGYSGSVVSTTYHSGDMFNIGTPIDYNPYSVVASLTIDLSQTDLYSLTDDSTSGKGGEGHTCEYTKETVLKEATCTEAGQKKLSCRCGDFVTEDIPETGHKKVKTLEDKYLKTAATCKDHAVYYYDCDNCHEVLEDTFVDTKGALAAHQEKTKTTPATTKADGSKVTSCSVCKKTLKTSVINRAYVFVDETAAYTGQKIEQPVKVVDVNGKAISSKYYKVTYKNNKKVGAATATVTFSDNYKGTVTKTFNIVKSSLIPAKVSSVKVTAGKKAITVSWKKAKAATVGYEIQYSTDKKFISSVSKVKVGKVSTVSKEIQGLKAKTPYYVRMRAYNKSGDTVIYSAWTTVKEAVKPK